MATLLVSLRESPTWSNKAHAFDAVPRTVKMTKRLKKVKKKFFEMTDISMSPCEIIPCMFANPSSGTLAGSQVGMAQKQ